VRVRSGLGLVLAGILLVVSSNARADQEPGHERIDFTAYTLNRNEFAIGLGAAAYGIIDQVTIGTYVLPWFAFPLLAAPVATGFVKLRDWFSGPVAVSLRGTFLYLDATRLSSKIWKNASTSAGLLVIPVELSGSWRISPAVSQSLQLTWIHVGLGGEMPPESNVDVGLGGASTATSGSVSALTEWRLNRVVALTLRGTLLLGMSDIVLHADFARRDTRVNAKLGAEANYASVVGNVVPGVAFSWTHVNLQFGVGFGSNWLPIVGIPTRQVTVVPDADFYVRF
jgi:hypothetical protein